MSTLEVTIQRKLIKKLEALGYLIIRLRYTSTAGWPDILALKNNKVYFIEVKRPGGKLSKVQKKRKEQLNNEGFDVFVIDDIVDNPI